MDGGNRTTKNKQYAALKTRIFIIDLFLTVFLLAIFQFFLARPAARMAFEIVPFFYAACLIFSCTFLLFMYLGSFPLRLLSSFLVEKQFGLSNQDFGAWFVDESKSAGLSLLLSVIAIQVFYAAVRLFPEAWWAVTAGIWVFFSVVLARFLPVFLIPIFYRYLPIDDPVLRERVMSLASSARIKLMDVCRIDFSRKTAKANAAVVGLGRTRKVILADTLTDKFTPAEVDAVVAHEFGHCRYRHTWQLLALSGVITLAGFFILSLIAKNMVALMGASGLSDLRLLPALVFLVMLFGLALLPAQNLFSRVLERQADRFAIALTGDPESFISVMQRLAEVNLAEANPSLLKKIFLYTHPPVSERIRMAENIRNKNGEKKESRA